MILKAQYTAYTGGGKTANGTYPNENTCAAPKEIAFGTKIKVNGTGTKYDGRIYTVTDRGSAIKKVDGRYIFDLWLPNENICEEFGRRNGQAIIVDNDTQTSSKSKNNKKKQGGRDIVDVAIGEIGYKETGNNQTKYGAWYGMNGAAWCHMFVSWCANQAGVSSSVVPKASYCPTGMAWFKQRGLFKYKGNYTPKRGDIIYFCTNYSHVGIVEKCSGGTVYTIEGNSASQVRRRSYPLSEGKITGYGVPKYDNLNASSTSGSTTSASASQSSKKTSETELKYLKRILEKKKLVTPKPVSFDVDETESLPAGIVTVTINNGKKEFDVPALDGLKVVWERKGTPGKLTFKAKYDKKFKTAEGNHVLVTVDKTKFFYGFIFTRSMSKDGFIEYTVYDQLRYLKNKDTLVYKKKSADQVITMIAGKFGLRCGSLESTGYIIPKKVEENVTLFDIIQNALDETMMVKNKVYTLYDKVGKLRLSGISSMKVNTCLVDKETGQDFEYKTTIDNDVYNQIKLIYKNNEKGTFDLYMARDKNHINKWGTLQYTDTIEDPDIGKLKAQALLKLYDTLCRTLTIKGVIGNKKVRAGSLVPVTLNLQDIKISNYMLVEKVTHTFKNHEYTMDLVLSGGGFSG